MKMRRKPYLSDYVAVQYPIEDYKRLIFITLDIVENFLLELENGFNYDSNSIASYGEKYGSSQRNLNSKIESMVINNFDDKEKMTNFLNSYYSAYNTLTNEEKNIFDATFIDNLTDMEIIEKYKTYSKRLTSVRRSAIIKFCLKSGINRFVNVIWVYSDLIIKKLLGGDLLETCEPYYSTRLGQLYKGDCLEVMDYLIKKGVKVDAIITDPPYAVTGFSWDQLIPFEPMWDKLTKLIKDDGAIVLFGNEPFSSKVRMSNPKLYRYDWKWVKTQITGFQNAKFQPLRCYEDIMVFSKSGAVSGAKPPMIYYPQGTIPVNLKIITNKVNYLKENKEYEKYSYTQEDSNYPRNVFQIPREAELMHPTQKPVALMEYIVSTYTKKDDLVLDFTSGSGSTLLACEILNRKWIGIELTDKYCNVIKNRITKGIQLKLQLEYEIEKNKEE